MIPWKLQFSGIRDYNPTDLDVSGELDHILITGTNGSGKSTISFCWGAVLGSSKVDLEGLRSKNVPADQVWHATIHLIFLNEGVHRIDAPRYVRFSLQLEQKPNDLLKKRYQISEGDEFDRWETQTIFTSGDSVYNFRAYSQRILSKYAIDPDTFYLIWYQQEVNQFATMHPGERFRTFSEMTGIDHLQRDWESSRERVRDAEEAVEEAKKNQTNHKHALGDWKTRLDKFLDRQKRRKLGLQKYAMSLKVLEKINVGQADAMRAKLESWKASLQELTEKRDACSRQKKAAQARVSKCSEEYRELEANLTSLEKRLEAKRTEQKANDQRHSELASQMKEIQQSIQMIPLTELEVQQELQGKFAEQKRLAQESEQLHHDLGKLEEFIGELRSQIIRLEYQMDENRRQEQESLNWLRQYQGSHHVQVEIERLEHDRRQWNEELHQWQKFCVQLREEQATLQSNRFVSPRQEKSIRFFRERGVDVYPLRELIELDENSSLTQEAKFDAIKYTLFVQGKGFRPPTDLYHVELPEIVPGTWLIQLPEYHLKVREGLDDRRHAAAAKALWWVNSFLKDVDGPHLEDNILIDSKGRRGVQEEMGYILSERALTIRLQKLTNELQSLEQKCTVHQDRLEKLDEVDSTLRGVLPKIKDAEAFLSQTAERDHQRRTLAEKRSDFDTHDQRLKKMRERQGEVKLFLSHLQRDLDVLSKYQAVYQEFAQESEKIAELQRLVAEVLAGQAQLKVWQDCREELSDQLAQCERAMDTAKKEVRHLEREEADRLREEMDLQKRHKKGSEEHLQAIEAMFRFRKEFQALEEEPIKPIFAELEQEGWSLDHLETWNEAEASRVRVESKIEWEHAYRQQVDESAPYNYEKVKAEYDRGKDEVQRSILILSEVKDRMDDMEERLRATIRLRLHKIHERFSRYMEMFGFEGQVEWDMYSGRNGEMRYDLYIKARKKGHRGKAEDVGVKGRGGKVGKGVSGGEESLSSLLFALALLQTIEASPGFLVLDEFDSALDEHRKERVLLLYEQELKRKLIILTPKSHGESYLAHFKKAYAVYHDPSIPQSNVIKINRTRNQEA
ncbi:hypothetical protein [Tumebacillus permanentifrigoris]|uniref:Nuclease SbcCD subunit C n=1 Tax=Tumebacillus permanentifrigoris TaxID=378543 RepID=A0A316D247_9BACL|nr:hypothetical protein [Tumebacillus permanentifrigoris]PWK03962.1 chromosome segregation protein [Tumebacillus permanentifrigoris]